jgi:hypothetical protein
VGVSFEEPGIQAATLLLLSVAALLSLASVVFGLSSSLTGKDPLPKRIRRMLRRMPASVEDFRLRGVSLMLNGAGVMMLVSIVTTNVVAMGMLSPGVTYFVPSASVAFPKAIVFLVTVVAAIASIACFVGSYSLAVRVRYVRTHASAGVQPEIPPA